ncbi:helix-turn-helix domain-containing protein [Larsenimonas salina]|uniref:helix-turn-helix domain-containing protein n=1 Tax=Larsenimonas salina TaxID=1295565 RepID=UPI0020740E26|nr:helix-turn-helix domain-containing protein [Larsenimonas salina]MCM5705842.1 helix-turn-helix domain-containing protein [Larsenimonas salina]
MPQLTIGRMAKLYGLHRSTLYEAVAKGRVTAAINGKGQKILDLSEMIRVYGEPPGQKSFPLQKPTLQNDTLPDTPNVLEKFDALLEIVREQRDELRQLREEVAQLRRLPPPSDAIEKTATTHHKNEDPHGFRSLVQAIRDHTDGSPDR